MPFAYGVSITAERMDPHRLPTIHELAVKSAFAATLCEFVAISTDEPRPSSSESSAEDGYRERDTAIDLSGC